MIRITSMDVLVVNGIGHDTWAFEILDASGMKDKLKLIYANDGVYKVGLFVWDGYEEEATEAFVTIKNVKPVVDWTLGFFPIIDEGDEVAKFGDFTDPGADYWSATVDYGDGQVHKRDVEPGWDKPISFVTDLNDDGTEDA